MMFTILHLFHYRHHTHMHFLRALPLIFMFIIYPDSLSAKTDRLQKLEIQKVIVLEFLGSINPILTKYVKSSLSKIDSHSLVIIKLNTPGGLVSTTKELVSFFSSLPAPYVFWVTPSGASATSAGAILSASAHALFMNEATTIGAATPIGLGKDIEQGDQRAKAVNDLTAYVASLAETRGRATKPFQAMVEKATSFTAQKALEMGFIDGLKKNLPEVLKALEQKQIIFQSQPTQLTFSVGLEIENKEMSLSDYAFHLLADPSLAYLLFLAGMALLYFEFQAPGGYILGGLGAVLLTFSGVAFQILPLNFMGLIFVALGFALLILEFFVPSFGLLGIAGTISLVSGTYFLFDTPDTFMHIELTSLYIILFGVGFFALFVVWFLAREKKKQGLLKSFFQVHHAPAVVHQLLEEQKGFYLYQIKMNGEIWRARSRDKYHLGDKVTVSQDPSQTDSSLTLMIDAPLTSHTKTSIE
jgi:membrane-bound serine protease (ClpP class)